MNMTPEKIMFKRGFWGGLNTAAKICGEEPNLAAAKKHIEELMQAFGPQEAAEKSSH